MNEISSADGKNGLTPIRATSKAVERQKKVTLEDAERSAAIAGMPLDSGKRAKAHSMFGEWVTQLGAVKVSRGRLNWTLEATESAIAQLDAMMPKYESESSKLAAMRCKSILLQTQVDALKTMIASASKEVLQPDELPQRARSFPPGATVIANNAQVLVGNDPKAS